MKMKLDNITTQYRKFNENQALTEGQLNEFLDYFEDQDRLSRTRLSGVGIACGFKTNYTDLIAEPEVLTKRIMNPEAEIDLNTIVITQGTGVTTDGDLITLRRKGEDGETTINFDANVYKYFREYSDEVQYGHFRVGNTQIPLLEIVTQQEYDQLPSTTGFQHIRNLDRVYDKTVILYLESYSNDETPCQDADCDNNGAEQVSNLKVLLVDSELFEDLILRSDAKDTIYKLHNSFETLFDDLPDIEARRVILDPSIIAASQLKAVFQRAVNDFSDLSEGFGAIADTFKINLNLGGESLDTKLNSLLNPVASRLEDYQYRYDLLKDLIDTYNEIKGLLLHLNADCCPSITAFPKHLMLGSVGAKLELGKKTSSRHRFYNSHITTHDDENYERIVMLANRFVQKLNGFQSYIGPVKITPSNLYVRLGNKAIPYYYNVDKPLLTQWNFEKTKTDRETFNLSYHTANLASENFVQNPLNYNIDDNDFYRIEGHLGMPFEAAVQNINEIKTQYGLAFDVAVLLLKNDDKVEDDVPAEPKKVSIEELRKKLISISSDISKEKSDPKSTLLTLSKLDSELRLLNKVEFTPKEPSEREVVIVKEDPRKKEITTELLSEFLERKSGLEHLAGVEPGGTFVLICESEANNQVLADFSLPYLCCSKEKPNVAPIALDDKVSCMIGQTVIISVMDNDYDADSDLLTVVKKTDPTYGTVVLNSNGTFTYTHNNSANLKDSFTYCVNDGKDDSNIATVFIEIKSAPVAVDDHASTENGGFVDIAVKDNDYDLGNTPLTVFIKDHPTNGTLMLNSDGTVRYQHTNPTGLTDSFTYYINDGEFDSNIAKVTITIAPPPCDSGMDVVFIFDYTGSMSGQIEAAKTGAVSIVDTIEQQSNNNYRLGIVIADETGSRTSSGYQNAPAYISLNPAQKIVNEGANSSFQWITAMEVMSLSNMNNVSTFTTQLKKLNNSASGLSLGSGGGAPEPTDFALDRVIEANFAGAFRSNVAKYVIIITDDVPGGTDDRATDADIAKMNSLRDRCIAKSIKVIVLGQGVEKAIGGKYIWKELANATGGSWNSSYNATAIETAIRNGCGGSR